MGHLRNISELMAARCAGVPTRVLHGGHAYEPTESRAVLAHLDGVVSGLMHFLIISAAAGTPGLALASQPKFAELQGTLYSEELQADVLTRDFARPGELARAVVRFVASMGRARVALAAALPRVRERSRRNFDMLQSGAPCTAACRPCADAD